MKKLIIFEMANNHMGDFSHGKLMIEKFAQVSSNYKDFFDFAWKFQFRDFPTFIHKDFKNRMDIKYVKRFTETSLTKDEFISLKLHAEKFGFQSLCTGFDENSIDLMLELDFDIFKVASCSFTDWSLLEKIALCDKPLILSTAGTHINDIDNVVSFLENRNKNFSLMHCVGEYPTKKENLQLNQIDFLKNRYPNVKIGYSTHEEPNEFGAIALALAKGADISEKHVHYETDQYPINAYSVTPNQMDLWLKSAKESLIMCGIENVKIKPSEKEISDLSQFKRGVFAKRAIKKGEIIDHDDFYFAWPNVDGQLLANSFSKYNSYAARFDLDKDSPIMINKFEINNSKEKLLEYVEKVRDFIHQSGVIYPGKATLELSHHYGIESFLDTGITMITVVNRDYCKKLIIVLPGQNHPEQYHEKKEETFLVLHGEVDLVLNGKKSKLNVGDVLTINPTEKHSFSTNTGCVIEEVSSTHFINDSFYTDPKIGKNKKRKTFVDNWL